MDPKKIIFKDSEKLKGREINGYDFSKPFDLSKFLDSYGSTGFNASNVKKAIDIIKEMRKEKATIFLAYTSNIISSGLREVIAYLAKNNFVNAITTTAGGVEEDIIKTKNPFVLGEYDLSGEELREKGINRIGNILVPNKCYIDFEKIMIPFYKKILERQRKENKIFTPSELIFELGKETNDEKSILYWATKNEIPIFCPGLTDGSMGDMLYFFRKENPELKIDIAADINKINDIAIDAEKTGVIILGGGMAKHHAINANLFRNGSDYAVYISTGTEYDGSIGGAKPEEAVSWGKQKVKATSTHIEGDATIIFPLIVADAFSIHK